MKLHKSITLDKIMAAAEESMFGMSDYGFCIECGAEVWHVEPDTRCCRCDSCGERAVYGAEELLLMPR